MVGKRNLIILLLLFMFFVPASSQAQALTISAQHDVNIRMTGYDGLEERILLQTDIKEGSSYTYESEYQGLGLLMFPKGQAYPLILGKTDFTIELGDANLLPTFLHSPENEAFYNGLQKGEAGAEKYQYASLMLEAKKLLESSLSVKTIADLEQKKKEFHRFVSLNYEKLRHSDMVRRLLGTSFMMLESVKYHVAGEPVAKIKERYLHALVSMAGDWLKLLKPHIPENEVLNYMVELYYNRSMISYGSVLIESFPGQSYCPGEEITKPNLPDNLQLTKNSDSMNIPLGALEGQKLLSFVSSECPVSMVQTVSEARRLSKRDKTASMIVVPADKLSERYLSMQRLLTHNNIYFVDDEAWRKEHLPGKLKLPFLFELKD